MSKTQAIKTLIDSLRPTQRQVFVQILQSEDLKQVLHMSRRFGKTRILVVLALITAIHKDRSQIKYATDTQKAARKIVKPQIEELFRLIPAKFRGKWNSMDGSYKFFNGSEIHLAGVGAGHEESLRGQESHLSLIDEAGFVDGLDYLVSSILLPQHITTKGKLILASSSPLSPAHEFVDFINESKLNGSYYSYTIDSAGYDTETIEQFCKESGGAASTAWRREYLNEIVTDEELAIVPEFSAKNIETQHSRPKYFSNLHKYVAMDIGVRDKTAVIWAYYDFPKARLVIEREWSISGQGTTTAVIAEAIKTSESALGYSEVYRRIADNNNLLLLNDLGSDYQVYFAPTSKDSLAAMVNELRLWVQQGRLAIDVGCKELIACLEYGVYQDHKRNMFGRSKTLGHFDLLAALIYLVRNIDQHTNPIPATYGTTFDSYIPPDENKSATEDALRKMFNL